eukprot:145617-Rhodomonas_salina.2
MMPHRMRIQTAANKPAPRKLKSHCHPQTQRVKALPPRQQAWRGPTLDWMVKAVSEKKMIAVMEAAMITAFPP